MTDQLELLDYYTLLGLELDASSDEIRRAFHTFALKFHPDNHTASDTWSRSCCATAVHTCIASLTCTSSLAPRARPTVVHIVVHNCGRLPGDTIGSVDAAAAPAAGGSPTERENLAGAPGARVGRDRLDIGHTQALTP